MLKLVACTKVWHNMGNADIPMWRAVGANEYIIKRFEEPPAWTDVGEAVTNFMHVLEGRVSSDVVETYTGFELYENNSLTHGENFQLEMGGTIDFPAEDITQIDVREAMAGIAGEVS